MKIYYSVVAVILFSIVSCENQQQKEERVAKRYCASCHAFPEPSLLDKKTWEKKTLPEMAFRMGFDLSQLNNISYDERSIVLESLPDKSMVTIEEWELIKQYYLTHSPDSLTIPEQIITDTLKLFEVKPLRLPISKHSSITLIKSDTLQNKIYLGNRPGNLFELDNHFLLVDSFQLGSAPSKMMTVKNADPLLLLMGIMDPNEQPAGKIANLDTQEDKLTNLIDSLQRPVDFEKVDLNNDQIDDYVVCSFGNHTGSLLVYESIGNGKFKKHILQNLPGARKIVVRDFDDNGMNDIVALMSQGDERIILFHNQGNFKFRLNTLLRFNAVYGSSYFEIADFNTDGKFDILYTNGDNADYSTILKPYHGIRIFLNNGKNGFKESSFYPMHGASQTRIADFDKDGDLDIAAISFFPDFKNHPENGFVYLENTPNGFIPQITPAGKKGRWLTMEASDFDRDGDTDILLGCLAFPALIPKDLFQQWSQEQISILILRNKLIGDK